MIMERDEHIVLWTAFVFVAVCALTLDLGRHGLRSAPQGRSSSHTRGYTVESTYNAYSDRTLTQKSNSTTKGRHCCWTLMY